jgi:hypothetical protein
VKLQDELSCVIYQYPNTGYYPELFCVKLYNSYAFHPEIRVNGGFSLDDGRQLCVTQPKCSSSGRGEGGESGGVPYRQRVRDGGGGDGGGGEGGYGMVDWGPKSSARAGRYLKQNTMYYNYGFQASVSFPPKPHCFS